LHGLYSLDTGATDHICSSLALFSTSQKIDPLQVKPPNGNVVMAHFAGSVQLSQSMVIFNVLLLPQFSFNLLFFSKLTSQLNCNLVFGTESCLIHELRILKTIGLAKQLDGLYHLDVDWASTQSVSVFHKHSTHNLITDKLPQSTLSHLRLGHFIP